MANQKPPKHPGKTPAQRRALDAIGCGNYSPIMANSTRDALLKAGLIVEISPRHEKAGALWAAVVIRQFQMPIPVHMQWCAAVAGDEEDPDHG